jgi:hypothetical protein
LVFAISRPSFLSVVASRLFPGQGWRKQAACGVALAILAAASCGGDGSPELQTVSGAGYRFEAPGDWRVQRSGRTLSAVPAEGEAAISVTSFRLARPFRPALWKQAEEELDDVADRLAAELEGVVESRATIRIAGRRARNYHFSGARDATRRIGFVLDETREYQLLCRGDAAEGRPCDRLFTTFALT